MGNLIFKKGKERVESSVKSFYDLSANDIDGKLVNMN